MTIGFNSIPKSLRTPGSYTEFDNSNAVRGLAQMPYRALLIGQKLAAGTVATNVPTPVTNAAQVAALAGAGSQLDAMARKWFANNDTTETWLVALDDDAAAVAATSTITVTGTATAAGTLSLYIGGQLVRVAVALNDVASAIATKAAAAINAATGLTVTAAAAGAVVTLTAKNKGIVGNDCDVRINYRATEEALPAGITVAIVPFANGTANPVLTSTLAALGDTQYHVILMPYTDAASLTALETELADRWGPLRQIEGMVFVAAAGTHATINTLGNSRNSPFVCLAGAPKFPNQPMEVAAAVAANVAFYAAIDPARPFTTLVLKGILAPAKKDELTRAERNLHLFDGVSTLMVDAGGNVVIERLITTYQVNAFGGEDPSYLNINIPLTLGYLRYDWRSYITRKYPRHKVGDDGNKFGAGQPILTPLGLKAEAVARFQVWQDAALVENLEQFRDDTFAERNSADPDRLDILMVPDLVNQLMVIANKVMFIR